MVAVIKAFARIDTLKKSVKEEEEEALKSFMEQFKLKESVEPNDEVKLQEEVRPKENIDELERKRIHKDFIEKYKFSQEELDEFEERFESLGRKKYAQKHKRNELDVKKLEKELKKRGKKEFRERLKWTERKLKKAISSFHRNPKTIENLGLTGMWVVINLTSFEITV